METSADPAPRSKDLKSQIANFEELVGNILSTGEQAGRHGLNISLNHSNMEYVGGMASPLCWEWDGRPRVV